MSFQKELFATELFIFSLGNCFSPVDLSGFLWNCFLFYVAIYGVAHLSVTQFRISLQIAKSDLRHYKNFYVLPKV